MKRPVADVTSDADVQVARRTARSILSQCPKIVSDKRTNSLAGLHWNFKGGDGKIQKLEIGMELSSRTPVWTWLEKELDGIIENIQETTEFATRNNNYKHCRYAHPMTCMLESNYKTHSLTRTTKILLAFQFDLVEIITHTHLLNLVTFTMSTSQPNCNYLNLK